MNMHSSSVITLSFLCWMQSITLGVRLKYYMVGMLVHHMAPCNRTVIQLFTPRDNLELLAHPMAYF